MHEKVVNINMFLSKNPNYLLICLFTGQFNTPQYIVSQQLLQAPQWHWPDPPSVRFWIRSTVTVLMWWRKHLMTVFVILAVTPFETMCVHAEQKTNVSHYEPEANIRRHKKQADSDPTDGGGAQTLCGNEWDQTDPPAVCPQSVTSDQGPHSNQLLYGKSFNFYQPPLRKWLS